jgi:hypothetical protein
VDHFALDFPNGFARAKPAAGEHALTAQGGLDAHGAAGAFHSRGADHPSSQV